MGVTMKVFRGDANGGALQSYEVETYPGMVVLDAIHDIQAKQGGERSAKGDREPQT